MLLHVRNLFSGVIKAPFSLCNYLFTVTGYPEPEIRWYKGDRQISPSSRYVIEQDKNVCHLTIHKGTPEDAGEWRCLAVNPFGQAWSSCDLKILGKHNIIDGKIFCLILIIMTLSNRLRHLTVLACSPLTQSVAFGFAEAIPEGHRAPRFPHELEDMTVTRGSMVQLECEVIGFPQPAIEWYAIVSLEYFNTCFLTIVTTLISLYLE